MEAINIDNYKSYIGKKVEVEIYCYEGGMMYPDENILVGMNPDYFYFYSEEDQTYWHWKAKDDESEKHKQLNCSIDVWA